MSDSEMLRLVMRIDRHLEKVCDLAIKIRESSHPNAEYIYDAITQGEGLAAGYDMEGVVRPFLGERYQ